MVSRVGAVETALAFNQYGPGSISRTFVKRELSLLILYSILFLEVFPRVLQFSPLTKTNMINFDPYPQLVKPLCSAKL